MLSTSGLPVSVLTLTHPVLPSRDVAAACEAWSGLSSLGASAESLPVLGSGAGA